MIEKREILAISQQTSLTPHIVEKDYVLGWMLAGIYGHAELAENWAFKGGTCLKKCYIETHRFSEDGRIPAGGVRACELRTAPVLVSTSADHVYLINGVSMISVHDVGGNG